MEFFIQFLDSEFDIYIDCLLGDFADYRSAISYGDNRWHHPARVFFDDGSYERSTHGMYSNRSYAF